MTLQQLQRLTAGDWVRDCVGNRGAVQWFGHWNGKGWQRASRKRATGAWIWYSALDADGYESAGQIELASTPLLGRQND